MKYSKIPNVDMQFLIDGDIYVKTPVYRGCCGGDNGYNACRVKDSKWIFLDDDKEIEPYGWCLEPEIEPISEEVLSLTKETWWQFIKRILSYLLFWRR